MLIYIKITIALAVSALLIVSNALLGGDGLGRIAIAFAYAGFLLAGAFYFVSAAEKYILRQKVRSYRMSLRETNSRKSGRQYQPLYNRMKIVR